MVVVVVVGGVEIVENSKKPYIPWEKSHFVFHIRTLKNRMNKNRTFQQIFPHFTNIL
jgi:hypothetical protein